MLVPILCAALVVCGATVGTIKNQYNKEKPAVSLGTYAETDNRSAIEVILDTEQGGTEVDIQYCPSEEFGAETYFATAEISEQAQFVKLRDDGLEPGKWYFRARVFDSKGTSEWSDVKQVNIKTT